MCINTDCFTCVAVGSWCSRDTLDWKCVDNTASENKKMSFEFYLLRIEVRREEGREGGRGGEARFG